MANERDLSSSFAIRHTVFVIWLLVLLPVAVLFGSVFLSDRSFAMRDAAHFYHPLFEWTAKEWGNGHVPLWNPDENCGMPVLADASSSVFYPGKLIFILPLDFTLLYKLYVVGHVLLAAVGSYLLARHWKVSQAAAGAAALAYACGGNVVFQYCNVVFLLGAAWLPFAALATDWMLASRSWRGAVAIGVVLALMILGGEPQAAYHSLLMAGLYALFLGRGETADGADSIGVWKRLRASPLLARLVLLGLAASVGFLLAAVQILPSAEASRESERAAYRRPRSIFETAAFLRDVRSGALAHIDQPMQEITHGLIGQPDPGTHHERAYFFSVGPWRLAEMLWPNISGRMFPSHRRWLSLFPAEGRIWTPTLYMGLFPALLGLAQLRWRRGDARQRWLTWLVILFVLGSFGWYGLGWVLREFCAIVLRMDRETFPFGSQVGGVYWIMTTFLPSYVNFRYPAKLLVVVALALAQLAALGWDHVFAEQRKRFIRVLEWLGGSSGILLAVTWGASVWLGYVLKSEAKDWELKKKIVCFLGKHADGSLGPFDWRRSAGDVEFAFAQTAAVCFLLHWLLGKAWREPEKTQQWQLAALLLVAVDLALANQWLVPGAPAKTWREPPIAAQKMDLKTHPRVFRGGLGAWRPAEFRQEASSQRMSEVAQWERDTLFPKYGLNHGIGLVESYGSLKSVHHESLLYVARSFGPQQPRDRSKPLPNGGTLRLLGTEYLLLPENVVPGTSERQFAERLDLDQPAALGAALWKMKAHFPRAWIVHQVTTLPPLPHRLDLDKMDERSMDVLFPENRRTRERIARDFRNTAVVESTDRIELAKGDARASSEAAIPAQESCHIVKSDPARVEIEVRLQREGLVVLGDTYAPGWVATLRSESDEPASRRQVPIYRTNRIQRGVVVPAGRHILTFEYRPASFYRGATASGLSWFGLVMTLLLGVVRRRKGA